MFLKSQTIYNCHCKKILKTLVKIFEADLHKLTIIVAALLRLFRNFAAFKSYIKVNAAI